jgi:hypothetical protein
MHIGISGMIKQRDVRWVDVPLRGAQDGVNTSFFMIIRFNLSSPGMPGLGFSTFPRCRGGC